MDYERTYQFLTVYLCTKYIEMKFINTIILALGMLTMLNAQQWCGTVQDEAFMQDITNNKKHWATTLSKSNQTRFVPITFHLVGQNDGSGRISEELVLRALCLLNDRYEALGVGIHFYVEQFNEINRTTIWNNPQTQAGLMRSFTDDSSMNMFIVNDIPTGGTGRVLGYYTGGINDFIVMLAGNTGDTSFTLEHEIGHFFTLSHTHRGWEDEPWTPGDAEKVTATTISSSQSAPIAIELVDGSNCQVAGDRLCDTPADYGVTFTCGCCENNDIILDRNCDTLAPLFNNIMSYSANCSEWMYTQDQITAMQASFDAPNRAYLRAEEVFDYTPIIDGIANQSPALNETVPVFDRVELTWDPVPNADFYDVTIKGETFRTTTNSYVVTDLAPNETIILWNVRAFNIFGSSCLATQAPEIFFNVGSDQTSAVSNIASIEDINIFPNPVSGSGNINLSFDSGESFTGDLRLYDVTGQVVHLERSVRFSSGSNNHNFSLDGLSSGIHILEISSDKGSITQKLIIE